MVEEWNGNTHQTTGEGIKEKMWKKSAGGGRERINHEVELRFLRSKQLICTIFAVAESHQNEIYES